MLDSPNPDAADFLKLMKGDSICCEMIVGLIKEGYTHESVGSKLE